MTGGCVMVCDRIHTCLTYLHHIPITARLGHHIKHSVLKGESCTAAHTKHVLGIQASAHTTSCFLDLIGLHACRPCRKHKLTKKSALVQCVWAESLRNWTNEHWKLIIFTDESKVILYGSDSNVTTMPPQAWIWILRVWTQAQPTGWPLSHRCLDAQEWLLGGIAVDIQTKEETKRNKEIYT